MSKFSPDTFDPNDTSYLDHLEDIAEGDVAGLEKAQASYGNSWKKRGGVGAWMMLARKWDRLEARMAQRPQHPNPGGGLAGHRNPGDRYDIFHHIDADERSEGVIDDIRDLRRYLLLVETEMVASGAKSATSEHRDNS